MYFASLALYIYVVLWLDGLGVPKTVQHLLGAATFVALLLAARRSPPQERREMWFCVGWSTAIELFATQIWGLYHYRFGNVPLYVPPGHGLIFLVALQASRTEWIRTHARALARGTVVVATAWAAWGLFGRVARPDVHGALYWPFFVAFMLRSKKATVWTITFAVTTYIELVGVRFGTWHWSPVMPGLGWTSGDPPSLVAGGYCSFAVVAVWLCQATRFRTTAAAHTTLAE